MELRPRGEAEEAPIERAGAECGGGITAHDIACRIMRKENYLIASASCAFRSCQSVRHKDERACVLEKFFFALLPKSTLDRPSVSRCACVSRISLSLSLDLCVSSLCVVQAMLNARVLALTLPLPRWAARASPRLAAAAGRTRLTRTLEWSLHCCILDHIFSKRFAIRRAFVDDEDALRRRFRLVGATRRVSCKKKQKTTGKKAFSLSLSLSPVSRACGKRDAWKKDTRAADGERRCVCWGGGTLALLPPW